LKDEQQSGALVALQQVDESLRQAVLDEWDARCRNSAVRNPAGYLFGIIQKAIRGEFKAWAGEGGGIGRSAAATRQPVPRPRRHLPPMAPGRERRGPTSRGCGGAAPSVCRLYPGDSAHAAFRADNRDTPAAVC
jgi:hypothetical protein